MRIIKDVSKERSDEIFIGLFSLIFSKDAHIRNPMHYNQNWNQMIFQGPGNYSTMDPTGRKRIDRLTHRLNAVTKVTNRLKAIDQRFFWYRLSAFLGAWVFAILTRFLLPGMAWLWVLLAMFTIFLVVVYFHRKLDQQRLRYQVAQEWLTQQIARATLDWNKIPESYVQKSDGDHPFMNDLNLVGERSLFQLLDTTATQGGQSKLLTWILSPHLVVEEIQQRQALVKEILQLPGFRTRLTLAGLHIKHQQGVWYDTKIISWLKNHTPRRSLRNLLVLLTSLAILNYVLLALNLFAGWQPYWQFSFILYIGIYFYQYRVYQSTFQDAYQISKDLKPLESILHFLETYPTKPTSQLAKLLSNFSTPGRKPSKYLRKILWISSAASLQNNQILSLFINALLPWDIIITYILDGFKKGLIAYLPDWLNTWYKTEALTALANFAYLNPEYHFPLLNPEPSTPLWKAVGLGHPLIHKEEKIVNDFSIGGLGEVAIISGSNMSGKSTFLRTLGINLVLAYTGTVVNASQLETIFLRLFTCIQVSDSLKDGFSYFYAEVRRLKQLLTHLKEPKLFPVFYLIDEIFQGTNHEERRIGSMAYIKALVDANGVGAISTHDIELSKLAERELRIHNYNFQDKVVDGKMSFDYHLRPGPSPTTNALKIMAIEGLPIDG